MRRVSVGFLVLLLLILSWTAGAVPVAAKETGELSRDAVARLGFHRFVHSSRIISLAFAPDDSGLLAVTQDSAWLWDLAKGSPRHVFPKSSMCGALSSDGRSVVLAESGSPLVDVYDAITGAAKTPMKAAKERSLAVALSPDSRLAASTDGGDLLIWKITQPTAVRRVTINDTTIDALEFSPDGHRLACAGVRSGEMRIIDLERSNAPVLLAGTRGFEPWFVFSPDGKRLIGACEIPVGNGVVKSSLRCWDSGTGRMLYDIPGSFESGAISPDGRWIAGGGLEHVVIYETATGRAIHRLPPHRQHIWALAFSPDGKTLASGQDQRVRLWRTDSWREIFPGEGHSEPIQAIAFSPMGGTIATGGLDGRIIEWGWPEAKEIRRTEGVGDGWGVQHLTFSPDGERLAVTAWVNMSNPFFLFDSKHLTLLQAFGQDHPSSGPLAFLSGGNHSGTEADTAVWHLRSGDVVQAKTATNVVRSPDGHVEAMADGDELTLSEVLTGKQIHRFKTGSGNVRAMAFSPDGTVLVSSDYDDAVVWDMTGQLKDGRLLKINLSAAGMAKLWETLAGDDGWAAYHAAWKLAADGTAGVAFLAQRMPPATINPDRILALRLKVKNGAFDGRQHAARQLRDMGVELRPEEMEALRRPSPAVDDLGRSAGLLPPPALPPLPDRLRSSRAIIALEHSTAAEALSLLDTLADGNPTAPQTIEAKSALAWRRARPDGR